MINKIESEIMMEIKPTSRLLDVLNQYPQLEHKVMSLAPPFKNLKNPILRKTVAKLATMEKVAVIGNLEPLDFVNTLREEIGQPAIETGAEMNVSWQTGEPEWIKQKPYQIVDGTEMLGKGEHPLQKVNQLMRKVKQGDMILLKTNFRPIPLIEEMEKQSYVIFCKAGNNQTDQHYTYIMKT